MGPVDAAERSTSMVLLPAPTLSQDLHLRSCRGQCGAEESSAEAAVADEVERSSSESAHQLFQYHPGSMTTQTAATVLAWAIRSSAVHCRADAMRAGACGSSAPLCAWCV